MDGHWWIPHMFWWIWIFPLSFLLICLVFLVTYLARGPHWFNGRPEKHLLHEAAREILDRRYASGEITREQYAEMKRDLRAE
jgi:putative membrane protein